MQIQDTEHYLSEGSQKAGFFSKTIFITYRWKILCFWFVCDKQNLWLVKDTLAMWSLSGVSCLSLQRWNDCTALITLTASWRTWRGRGSAQGGSKPGSPGSCSQTAASGGSSSPSSSSTVLSSSTASTLYGRHRHQPPFIQCPPAPHCIKSLIHLTIKSLFYVYEYIHYNAPQYTLYT